MRQFVAKDVGTDWAKERPFKKEIPQKSHEEIKGPFRDTPEGRHEKPERPQDPVAHRKKQQSDHPALEMFHGSIPLRSTHHVLSEVEGLDGDPIIFG